MFTISDNPTFKHAVKVQVPVDGGHKEETIQATYKVLPVEKAESYDLSRPADALAFLQTALVHLDDLVDVNKQPVPYSDELRDRVLSLPYARLALANGYFEAVARARLGN